MSPDDVFPVIADPTRRRILRAVSPGDRSVGELVDELSVSQPTVSKHLKVLRDAGLVSMRAAGQRRFYALEPAALAPALAWLETLAGAGAGAGAGSGTGTDAGTVLSGAPMEAVDPQPVGDAPAAPAFPVVEAVAPEAPEPAPSSMVPVLAAPAVRQEAPASSSSLPLEGTTPAAQQLGRTVGRTVGQVTGRAQDLLERLPKPKFGRRR
jgi:DNA-binding transcriptional ArsR family regulator